MGAPEPALLCLTSRDACSRDARKAAIVLSSVIHVLRQRSVALAQPACLAVNHLSAYVMQTRDVPALRFQILPLCSNCANRSQRHVPSPLSYSSQYAGTHEQGDRQPQQQRLAQSSSSRSAAAEGTFYTDSSVPSSPELDSPRYDDPLDLARL